MADIRSRPDELSIGVSGSTDNFLFSRCLSSTRRGGTDSTVFAASDALASARVDLVGVCLGLVDELRTLATGCSKLVDG